MIKYVILYSILFLLIYALFKTTLPDSASSKADAEVDESKIVLVDIDDTIWDLAEAWIDWLNNKYNRSIKCEDCKTFGIQELYPDLTYEQAFEPLFSDSFWDLVKPKKDAQVVIPKLQELGYIVKLVSSSRFREVGSKLPKVLEHFPTLTEKDVIICYDKWLVRGDYLIDDNIVNMSYRKHPVLIKAWHNRNISVDSPVIKVDTWDDVLSILEKEIT